MNADDHVRHFLDLLAYPKNGLDQLLHDELDSECIWEIVGLFRAVGPRDSAAQFMARGWAGIKVTILRTLPVADTVMVEGVRTFLKAQGITEGAGKEMPFMSVLTVSAGRIAAWRDYLDTTSLRLRRHQANEVA